MREHLGKVNDDLKVIASAKETMKRTLGEKEGGGADSYDNDQNENKKDGEAKSEEDSQIQNYYRNVCVQQLVELSKVFFHSHSLSLSPYIYIYMYMYASIYI
mgnify:FL=1